MPTGAKDKLKMRTTLVLPFLLLVPACVGSSGEPGECAGPRDCRPLVTTCAGCPEQAEVLCTSGACVDAAVAAVDVVGDVSLHRDVAADVRSIVHFIVAIDTGTGRFRCDDLDASGAVPAAVNVLSSGYKSVSGGAFHPELALGRVPVGEVAVVVLGTAENAGQGGTLGLGCVEDLEARSPRLEAGIISVGP